MKLGTMLVLFPEDEFQLLQQPSGPLIQCCRQVKDFNYSVKYHNTNQIDWQKNVNIPRRFILTPLGHPSVYPVYPSCASYVVLSETIGGITMKSGTDIHAPLGMNDNTFSHPLTFQLAAKPDRIFNLCNTWNIHDIPIYLSCALVNITYSTLACQNCHCACVSRLRLAFSLMRSTKCSLVACLVFPSS